MCVKKFLGFACGHCSVPWIIKCPTAQADPSFPVCSMPAEHPIHQTTLCHPCFRVQWNAEVLVKENAHKKLHREGKCNCETVFPDLHDVEIRPQYNWAHAESSTSPLQSGQVQPGGPGEVEIMNAYLNYVNNNWNPSSGIAVAYHLQQLPQSQEQHLSLGQWARQYVHDRPNQRLYYDHEGNIFLFNPDTTENNFVEIPEGLRDINELPPVPAREENGRYEFSGAWVRKDFKKLDNEKLRYGSNPPGHILTPQFQYGPQSHHGLHQSDVSTTSFGFAGPSNYAGHSTAPVFGAGSPMPVQQQIPTSSTPPIPSYTRIPAWQFRGPTDWGNNRTEALVSGAHYWGMANPENRGFGGGRYRPATYGTGSRYYSNTSSPSPSLFQPTQFPGTPTQVQNVRPLPVPTSSSNIEVLTQFQNLRIGSGVPEWQRQGAMHAQRRSMRTTGVRDDFEGGYTPKVKLPVSKNGGEGSSASVLAPPTTSNTPNVENPVSEGVSGVNQGISGDLDVFSAAENVGDEVTTLATAGNTNIHQPSVVTAPNSPKVTSPVIEGDDAE